jgi:N-methylhydantoinase B
LRSKGVQEVPGGDRLVLETAGGGGIGSPSERDPARVTADVMGGLVSVTAAARDYSWDAKAAAA